MQEDYKRLIGTTPTKEKDVSFGINTKVHIKDKKLFKTNMCDKLDKDLVQSISLIVDNSGYTADYLRRCYYIEFIMILKQVSKKLKQ